MLERVHVALLRVFRRLPATLRRWLIRVGSPSFTVGAVCVIERPDGAVLLVRQVYRARWGLPGGLLKRGEDAADAARREVLEEVGVAIELVGEPASVIDAKPQRVDVVYRARLAASEAAVPAPQSPEILEARWFPRDQLPELQHETGQALVALARSAAVPHRAGVTEDAPSPGLDVGRGHASTP